MFEIPVDESWRDEALRMRERGARSYLFLCVANSARSQMAEGVARSLAPANVTVASAGSKPTQVRPEAVAVMAEVGVDLGDHRSTSVQDVVPTDVDVVVTLCADEVCPIFPGNILRIHWGLPDPAAVTGDEAARLEAFRMVRDELQRRLATIFAH
jgi:thioredoxin type arsenate reductase